MVSTSSTSFLGSYSGITMETIDQLISAESGKLTQYTNKQTTLTNEKNAWKDINTRLDSLSSKMNTLKEASSFQSKVITNSNESLVSISGESGALNSDYTVSVEQLATSSQLTSHQIDLNGKKVDEKLGLSGTLSFADADGKEVKVNVTEKQSLKDIVSAVNQQSKTAESGLKATIIDNRIVVTDEQMGNRTITASGNLADQFGLSDAKNLTVGQSAKLTVNGISIERNTNNVTDAVEGLTIKLNKATTDETAKINVADDIDKTTKVLQEFVDQYNSVMTYIGETLDVGDPTAENNKTGALVGDSAVVRLQTQLRSLMGSSSSKGSDVKSLKNIGIEIDRYGKASLDTSKLKKAMAKDPSAVQKFFYQKETVTAEDGTTTEKETGILSGLSTFVNEYINSTTGIIATKSSSIDQSIKDLDKQIEQFNERLEVKRQRYITQFTALDTAMMQAESQMQYLSSQIGSVTGNNAN